MAPIIATASNAFIIGPVAKLFGYVMNWIFNLGVTNLGVCIILFTIIVYMLQLPLTISQQKFSRLQMIMQPEIQAIQKKYRNQKDQASQLRMQEETRAVYDKYGTSMTSGCLPLFIQFPILIGFYRVIYNIPAYVPAVKNVYSQFGLVDMIKGNIASDTFIDFAKSVGARISEVTDNTIVDTLWKLQANTWNSLKDLGKGISGFTNSADQTKAAISQYTTFCGLSIAEAPLNMIRSAWASKSFGMIIVAVLIPVLAGGTQFLSMKLMPQASQNNNSNDQTARTMNSMNTFMPLFSVFICFTLPFGLGIYWIMSAVVRCIQMIFINRHLSKMDIEQIVEKNKEKAKAKQEKRKSRGITAENIEAKAKTSTRNIRSGSTSDIDSPVQKGAPKPGSLAEKANMVKKYNETHK